MKKKKAKIIISTLVAFFYLMNTSCFYQNEPKTFDSILVEAANELNKQCPFMVDKETILDNALPLPDNTVQYNYTLINSIKDSMDINSFIEYMGPLTINQVKTEPGLKIYRDNNCTMIYCYKDKNGIYIHKFYVVPENYK